MSVQKSHVLAAIHQFYPDYHPLVAIAHLAHSDAVDVDARLRFDCHRTIAKYVEPELKSLEVRGTVGEARRVTVSLFDEDVVEAELVEPTAPKMLSSADIDKVVDVY